MVKENDKNYRKPTVLFLPDLCRRQFGLKFGTIITFRANEMKSLN